MRKRCPPWEVITKMATAEKSTNTDGATSEAGIGRVVRVAGPVVDVEFPRDQLPQLFNALTVQIELEALRKTMTLEVAQHLGDNTVRTIAMQPADGLVRGAPVTDTLTPVAEEVRTDPHVDPGAPAGTHKNIFCQVVITENGEPVVHNLGGSELRIDVPLPPKKDAPPPAKTAAAPPPKADPATPPKRLSRLEQLRLEQEEREKAAKAATPPKK